MWSLKLFSVAVVILLSAGITTPMHMPHDIEILDGYGLETTPLEINPEDEFYEQRSLMEPHFYRAIRNKRNVKYRVLESPGLKSHFKIGGKFNHEQTHSSKRQKRSTDDVEKINGDPVDEPEELPIPEKQMINERVLEQWVKSPYQPDYHKVMKEDDDSEAESSINKGINARAPRVNFITQQNKNIATSESRDQSDKVVPELYRKPLAKIYYEYPQRSFDSPSAASSNSPMYPRFYDKYDQYHRDMMDRMHPPSPNRYDNFMYLRRFDNDYDSYFPRTSYPNYYYYPDKRYDLPQYRDRPYLQTNEVNPSSASIIPRNRRIIYYANLPEIVRTPPSVDLRYRYYNKYNNRNDPYYPTVSPMSAYKNDDRFRNKDRPAASSLSEAKPGERKEDKYVSSTPIKIVRETTDQRPPTSQDRRRYPDTKNGRSSYQDGVEDREHPYFSRHH